MKMWPRVGTLPIKTEQETAKLKACNQQLHHTEEAIMKVKALHLDKRNGAQPVRSLLTTWPNAGVKRRKM
jgi:hypothetical protein